MSLRSSEVFSFSNEQARREFCFKTILAGVKHGSRYPSLMFGNFNLGEAKVIILLDTIIENLPTIGLINIQLNGNQLTDAVVEKLIILLQNPLCTLKFLNLSHNNITSDGIEKIRNAIISLPDAARLENLRLDVDEDEILKYKRAVEREKKLTPTTL